MAKKKNWIVSLKIAKVFNGMGFFENINNPIGALVILSNICLNVVLYNGPNKTNNFDSKCTKSTHFNLHIFI